MKDFIGYGDVIENSMRSAVREILLKTQNNGLQGEHHFVISFLTNDSGVKISQELKEKFPDEMIIVVQHQFKDLQVKDDHFNISLSFNGHYEKLTIAFAAITSFSDPSMNFGVKFNFANELLDSEEGQTADDAKEDVDLSKKIISLDDFRKNHD
ncbi:ClpXP protease specificity-enhancing factor SspB [Rickettsiales bacterium]|nr:ClpXP protease specificity-enhancing factor SspB [Rickettsiales bacterium]